MKIEWYQDDPKYQEELNNNKELWNIKVKNRYDVLEQDIVLIEKMLQIAINDKNIAAKEIWNIMGYMCLSMFDITCLTQTIINEETKWKNILFTKKLILILYETQKDLPHLFGKKFRKIFDNIVNSKDYIKEMNSLLKPISVFTSEYEEYLKIARNTVSAHRDHDTVIQISMMKKMDPYIIIRLAIELEQQIRKLYDHIKKLAISMVQIREV